MRKIITLSLGDLNNIRRDGILILSLLGPILLAPLLRFGLVPFTGLLQGLVGLDLSLHYPIIVSFLALLTPMLVGILAGFLILDERDENILTYYAITPLTKTGYLFYRTLAPVVLGFGMTYLLIAFVGLTELNYLRLFPVIFMASLEAPMLALFLGTFAANKVEGLAVSKAMGITFMAPLAGYLVESNWHLLGGLFPPYWVTQAFLAAGGGEGYVFYTVVGLFVHVLAIYILVRKFAARAS
jgi:fluoroquinolone transport system permease protein